MRLKLNCIECVREASKLCETEYTFDLREDFTYSLDCRQGHKVTILMQAQRFELLSTIAGTAIYDGYYREAVSTFSTTLERFYEFYIKVQLTAQSIDQSEINSLWKLMSSQSERQTGAFVAVHTIINRRSPLTLHNNYSKFRNAVIHKGHLPDRDATLLFGEEVLRLIHTTLTSLRLTHKNTITEFIKENVRDLAKKSPSDRTLATLSIANLVSLTQDSTEPQTLKTWLNSRPARNEDLVKWM